MNAFVTTKQVKRLAPHDELEFSGTTSLWKVQSGALRIDSIKPDQAPEFVRLALPGDVLGVEYLVDSAERYSIHALTPVRVVACVAAAEDMPELVLQAFATANRRCREALQLRTGKAGDRVKCLMLMLSSKRGRSATQEQFCDLPSLADMAEITDSTKETVCRVIGSMRRLDFLQERKPLGASFSRMGLSRLQTMPGMTSSSSLAVLGLNPPPIQLGA